MDSPSNATTFANSQGFFPEFTTELSNPGYASSPILSGFAKAAGYTQISPLNSKNWATADATDAIIPTMMKALMKGAPSRPPSARPTPSSPMCSTPATSPDLDLPEQVPAGSLLSECARRAELRARAKVGGTL